MDVGKHNKIQKKQINGIFLNEQKPFIPAMHKKTKDTVDISTSLNVEAKSFLNELEKTKDEQGLIGNLWDGFKNLTKIGAGSNKVEKAIKEFNSGNITKEEVQQILSNYQDGQKTSVDVVADMISSIVSVGAFIAAVPSGGASLPVGLALSTALSTSLKVGIKGIDAKTNGREYNKQNLLYDVVTGAVNGLLAPVTNGFGSSLTKTIGCKLGLEITGDVLEAGTKSTLKNLIVNQSIDVAGGTIKQRALALGAGMAVDGALGGAADNTAREIIENKKDKNVFKAATEGFLGGLIMSPIIGGGFRLAGKLGSKIGDKISFKSNNTSDLSRNPFGQSSEVKNELEPTSSMNFSGDVQPEVKPIVQENLGFDIEVHEKSTTAPDLEVDNQEKVYKTPQADESATEAVLVENQVKVDNKKSDLSSEVTTEVEKTAVLTPEQILQNTVVKKLKDSLENIPVDVKDKKEFLKSFFMTNPKTGDAIKIGKNDYHLESIEEMIDSLLPFNKTEIAIVLEGLLDASIVQDRTNIYCSYISDMNKFVKTCRKCKQRNILGLYQEMRTVPNKRMIDQPYDFFVYGEMSDNDFDKALQLARHLKSSGQVFYFSTLPDFVTKTNKNTIDYMISNDLFNFENYSSTVDRVTDIFYRLKGIDAQSLKKIHQRGMLKPISEAERFIPIYEAKIYVSELSDERWQKAIDRNLFALKTNTNKELSDQTIITLARLDDELFKRLNSRGLLDKVGNNPSNIDKLILLDDEQWQKVLDRNIKIDKINFFQEEKLSNLLSISDEKWEIAEARGLDFLSDDDFLLLELSDLEWNNITRRNLGQKLGYRNIYDIESQIRLAKLTDDEFELAQKRNLIKGDGRKYNEQAFSEESEFLLRCNDEDFNLYSSRNIQSMETSLEKKKDLFSMTDEQFSRVKDDIVPKMKKYESYGYGDDKLTELYRLAFLDEEQYNEALKFVGLDSLGFQQFTYDEILQIISIPPAKRDLLLNLVSYTEPETRLSYKKDSLLKLIQYSDEQYEVVNIASGILSLSQLNDYIISDAILSKNFLQNLEQNRILISKINGSDLSKDAKKVLIDRLLCLNTDDYSKLNLREKIKQISKLQEAQNSNVLASEESLFLNLDEEIIRLQDSIKHVIQTTNVTKAQTKNMFSRFFANDDVSISDLLTDTDFVKFGKDGLPLEYPRKKFLEDLSIVLKTLDVEQQKVILNKLGISLVENDGKITGYNGIINLNKLSNEGSEGDVLLLARKFIKENRVNTDDEKLNEILNSLIEGMPEFINIIGKQQHRTHDFSLDIHSLNVLKSILENPEYQKLSNEDKFCLKLVAILHDIAKADGVVDKQHEQLCALYAKDILTKDNMNMPRDFVNRIFNLIQNHNWLEEYSKDSDIAPELAVKFRRQNDHKIAQIFAEADLKSVKADGSFLAKHKHVLGADIQNQILMNVAEINKKGHMFLTNKIINSSKVPTITKNGKTYKVIDFSKMSSGTDLFQYGFEPGTTYDNLRLFLHAVKDQKLSNILNVINLQDPNYEGFLCASYASLLDVRTYGGNKFGVSIESSNVDIANASINNQGSGTGKSFERFSDVLTGKDRTSKYRDLIPMYIQNALDLTEEEYSELFSKIQRIKFTSQFDNIQEIKVGQKSFSGEKLKEAILYANDQLMQDIDGKHNELNLYTPKTNAIFARVDSFDEVPEEILNIAEYSDLPIFILGSD